MTQNPPSLHQHGTYAAAYVSAHSQQLIHTLVNEHNIPRSDELGELHCTVLYSTKPYPQALYANVDFDLCIANATGYEDWKGDDGKRYLVMRIDCHMLTHLHEKFVADGASYSYPEYKPHITITDTWDGSTPLVDIPVPKDLITFSRFVVEPLKEK